MNSNDRKTKPRNLYRMTGLVLPHTKTIFKNKFYGKESAYAFLVLLYTLQSVPEELKTILVSASSTVI